MLCHYYHHPHVKYIIPVCILVPILQKLKFPSERIWYGCIDALGRHNSTAYCPLLLPTIAHFANPPLFGLFRRREREEPLLVVLSTVLGTLYHQLLRKVLLQTVEQINGGRWEQSRVPFHISPKTSDLITQPMLLSHDAPPNSN